MVKLNSFAYTVQNTFFSQILSGRNFTGEYEQCKAYNRGDIIVINSLVHGPKLYEAITDVDANTRFDVKSWTVLTTGNPLFNAGQISLSNTKEYPLNDSLKTITLKHAMDSTRYIVLTRYDDKNVDEVEVCHKDMESFSIRYWGSSPLVKINWAVIRED